MSQSPIESGGEGRLKPEVRRKVSAHSARCCK